jgi:osmotically-inducible protein OsmY
MLQNYKILNFFKNQKIILLAITLFSLTSCVETIVLSTGVGAGLAYREKTIDDTRSDIKISTKIALKFLSKGLKNPGNSIDITVNESRVMLTGIVRDPTKAKLAQELCWQVAGVNEVIDEIQIPADNKFKLVDVGSAFFDYLITAEIETKFALAKDLRTLNYQITTVNNEVYLLGVAIDEKEMNRAVSLASKVRGVTKVINHIILANDSRRGK